MNLCKSFAGLGVFCLLTMTGWGQSIEIGAFGGAFVVQKGNLGATVDTAGNLLDVSLANGFKLGFRITANTDGHLGWEGGYAYNRTALDYSGTKQGFGIHQGFAGPVWNFTKESSPIRPFVTAGVNFANFVPPGQSATYGGGETKFGGNYGAGVKVKLSDRYLVRVDVRQYWQPKPFTSSFGGSGWLALNEVSAGFAWVF